MKKKVAIVITVVVALMMVFATPAFAAPNELGALRHYLAPGQDGPLEPGELGEIISGIAKSAPAAFALSNIEYTRAAGNSNAGPK